MTLTLGRRVCVEVLRYGRVRGRRQRTAGRCALGLVISGDAFFNSRIKQLAADRSALMRRGASNPSSIGNRVPIACSKIKGHAPRGAAEDVIHRRGKSGASGRLWRSDRAAVLTNDEDKSERPAQPLA
jgi:hypothetical protein